MTNPPFGGKEGKDAQTHFTYKTRATQVLFLQHVIGSLKPGGRCGIVMVEEDTRTPEEILSIIDAQEKEISSALAALRSKGV